MTLHHVSATFHVPGDPDLSSAVAQLGLQEATTWVHAWEPYGTSWMAVGAERTVALHTWPEHGLVTVDLTADAPVEILEQLSTMGWVPVADSPKGQLVSDNEDGVAHRIAVEQPVFAMSSAFQHIAVVDTVAFGRALFLDGELQSAASDERLYHECLVWPAMMAHGSPKRVLVCGAGEGASLREVLRWSVTEVVAIEIDPLMEDVARRLLPTWHDGAWDDPRVRVVREDARAALAELGQFDVVILDLSDPVEDSPARHLFTVEWFREVQRHLSPGGVVVTQAGSLVRPDALGLRRVLSTFRAAFGTAIPYAVGIPSFGEHWSFVINRAPTRDDKHGSEWFPGMFDSLCEFSPAMLDTLRNEMAPLTDAEPSFRARKDDL